MSVLACSRNGCQNIMCDRYSHNFGYICYECFDELCESDMPVEDFMQLEKKEQYSDPSWKKILDEEFQMRD